MSRPKFAQEIGFHEVGEEFDLVGYGGTSQRRYKVLKTEGAKAEIIEVVNGKPKKGRPMHVLMVENFVPLQLFEPMEK
jgi:hypothetical protein